MLGNLFAALNDYITIPELAWTILGGLWTVFGIYNVREARRDRRALNLLKKNGYLKAIAIQREEVEWLRLGVYVVILGVGFFAMTQFNLYAKWSPVSVAVTAAFFAINLFTGLQSILVARLRAKLDDLENDGHV